MSGVAIWVAFGFASLIRCTQWNARGQILKATTWLVIAIFCASAAWI